MIGVLLSNVAEMRAIGLLRLQRFLRNMIFFSVFDKDSPSFSKVKGDVVPEAVITQLLDPFIMTWSGAVIILAAA